MNGTDPQMPFAMPDQGFQLQQFRQVALQQVSRSSIGGAGQEQNVREVTAGR